MKEINGRLYIFPATANWSPELIQAISFLAGVNAMLFYITKFHPWLFRKSPDPAILERKKRQLGPWIDLPRFLDGTWKSAPGAAWARHYGNYPIPGPAINYDLASGFCGVEEIETLRTAQGSTGSFTWTRFMAMVQPPKEEKSTPYERWRRYPWKALVVDKGEILGAPITRISFLAVLAMMSAKEVYRYSDGSGFRAAFECSAGVWTVEWPIGKKAILSFASRGDDCEKLPKGVHPDMVLRKVHKCVEMLAGVVTVKDDEREFKIAFQGRPGDTKTHVLVLQHGVSSSDWSSELYEKVGGHVHEVKVLARKLIVDEESEITKDATEYDVPLLNSTWKFATVLVPRSEYELLQRVLDNLPWGTVAWSMHAAMRDLLLAFGRKIMDENRGTLAGLLKKAVEDNAKILEEQGWDATFVQNSMAEVAETAILAGGGTTADAVRAVTAAAMVCCTDWKQYFDSTTFWISPKAAIDDDAIIALTKFAVLEWSSELDCQLHRELPTELLFI